MSPAGFPHSEILGSKSGYRLPEAYRRFPRPSSVPGAKASTVRPCKLETKLHKDARVHCTVLNTRPGQPQVFAPATHPPAGGRVRQHPGSRHDQKARTHPPPHNSRARCRPIPQDPTTCQHHPRPPPPGPFHTHHPPQRETTGRTRPPAGTTRDSDRILMFHPSTRRGTNAHATGTRHPHAHPETGRHQVPRCSLERR